MKTNKNDYLDAEAIAEAMQRLTMRFVPVNNDTQPDLQASHCVRDLWVARTTAVMNQIRGFLLDRGIVICKGPSYLAAQLQLIFPDGDSFSGRLLQLTLELKHEWSELERKMEEASAKLGRLAREDDDGYHRLMEVRGFGPVVSTALIAGIGDGSASEKFDGI